MTAEEAQKIAVEFAQERIGEIPFDVTPATRSKFDSSKWVVLIKWPPPAKGVMDGNDTLVVVDDATGIPDFY